MPVAGPYYSYAQLEYLWIANGGPAAAAPIAAAVAMAESGGGAGSTNPTDNGGRQTSWGLWQLSNGTHNQPVANVLDPNVNAQGAIAKYRAAGGTFARDWGTYLSGAYKQFLQSNVAPSSAGVPASTGASAASAAAQAGAQAAADAATGVQSVTLTAETSDPTSTCLLGIPSGVPAVGGSCLFTKTEARALIGGMILLAGVLVLIAGTIVLASSESAAASRVAAVVRPAQEDDEQDDDTAPSEKPSEKPAEKGDEKADDDHQDEAE